MGVDLRGMRSLRARGNNEDAGHFMRRLVQRNAVFERVDDAFGGLEPHGFVQCRILEAQVDECDAPPVARGDARDVPGGLCRPLRIAADGHQADQRRAVKERRNQMPEPRERQLPDGGHCPGW